MRREDFLLMSFAPEMLLKSGFLIGAAPCPRLPNDIEQPSFDAGSGAQNDEPGFSGTRRNSIAPVRISIE